MGTRYGSEIGNDAPPMTVSPRMFASAIGAVALLIGILALALPISLEDGVQGTVGCGSGFTGASDEAKYTDVGESIADAMYPSYADSDDATFESLCAGKVSSRQAWGWPVFAAGGVLVLGAMLIRQPPRRPVDVDPPSAAQ